LPWIVLTSVLKVGKTDFFLSRTIGVDNKLELKPD